MNKVQRFKEQHAPTHHHTVYNVCDQQMIDWTLNGERQDAERLARDIYGLNPDDAEQYVSELVTKPY